MENILDNVCLMLTFIIIASAMLGFGVAGYERVWPEPGSERWLARIARADAARL